MVEPSRPADRRSMKRIAPLIAILAAALLGVVVLAAGGRNAPQAIQQDSATAARVSRPARLKPPKISGTARVGVRLRASHGSWSHKPRSYKYTWERCNARGARCSAIRGARASSYLLAGRDLGRTVRVSVIALCRSAA